MEAGQHSVAVFTTKFKECPMQGIHSASLFFAATLACRPLYLPLMALALSHGWPRQTSWQNDLDLA